MIIASALLPFLDFPDGSDSKESAHIAVDLGLIPGSERSPGEGNGNPCQQSCLENTMDGGTWWPTVHGVAERHDSATDTFFLPFFKINTDEFLGESKASTFLQWIFDTVGLLWQLFLPLVKGAFGLAPLFALFMGKCRKKFQFLNRNHSRHSAMVLEEIFPKFTSTSEAQN